MTYRRTVADLVITEDSDLTLFGCDNIIFKLNDSVNINILNFTTQWPYSSKY